MTQEQLEHFKSLLLQEKALLETELSSIAKRNPDNPDDWEATSADIDDTSDADDNTVADSLEELENNAAILGRLENRYQDVCDALAKIDTGTYGVCEVSQQPIELDRLEANPAARTSKAHM